MANYCSDCTYLDLSTGDLYGKFWCEKRLERHQANEIECYRFCKAYSRSSNEADSAYQYSRDHSGSGCYITTIICNILGMPDNNEYLETLRFFRDNFLQKDERYKPSLVEYDLIGPKIANALKNDPLKEKIANKYFHNYIIPTCELIKEKKYREAADLYKTMTNLLKYFYGLNNMSITALDIDNADINKSGHGVYIKKITY